MKIARWGDSLAVRIPADVVQALHLQEGDEVDLHRVRADAMVEPLDEKTVLIGISKLRAFRGWMPADFKFDRDEANAR